MRKIKTWWRCDRLSSYRTKVNMSNNTSKTLLKQKRSILYSIIIQLGLNRCVVFDQLGRLSSWWKSITLLFLSHHKHIKTPLITLVLITSSIHFKTGVNVTISFVKLIWISHWNSAFTNNPRYCGSFLSQTNSP